MSTGINIKTRPLDDAGRGVRNNLWVKLEQFISDSLYKIRKGMAYDRALAIEDYKESLETNRLLRKLAGETEPSLTEEDKGFLANAKDVVDDLIDDGKRNHSNKANKADKNRGH